MDIQLEDISEPVLRMAGQALYFAQRLENSLITHLLVRKKITVKAISSAMIQEIEAKVRGDKAMLGKIIQELNDELGVAPEDSSFKKVLSYRNTLAHTFFRNYRHSGGLIIDNRRMLVDLEIIVIEFKNAINLLQQWTKGLAVTHGVDISQIDTEYETALLHENEHTSATNLIPRKRKQRYQSW